MTCSSAKHLLHLLISQEIAEALNHEQAIMSARHEQVKAAASHLLHSRIDYYALTIQQADPHACHSLCERYICMHSDTELVMLILPVTADHVSCQLMPAGRQAGRSKELQTQQWVVDVSGAAGLHARALAANGCRHI